MRNSKLEQLSDPVRGLLAHWKWLRRLPDLPGQEGQDQPLAGISYPSLDRLLRSLTESYKWRSEDHHRFSAAVALGPKENRFGVMGDQRSHILVKPSRPDLRTNLVIHSNRHSYHLELTSTEETWMAAVSWSYPLDQLVQLRRASQRAEVATPIAEGLTLERLNFRYDVSGDLPNWRPLRAFDDGEKVYIQFPAGIAQGEMPPLFVIGSSGDAQLVNYRVRAPYYVVDRLFTAAELRLGTQKDARVVCISRNDIAASRPQ